MAKKNIKLEDKVVPDHAMKAYVDNGTSHSYSRHYIQVDGKFTQQLFYPRENYSQVSIAQEAWWSPGTLFVIDTKGKAVLLQAWSGPEGSRKLSFPDFMTTAQDSGKVVCLTHRPPLPPRKCSRYSFLLLVALKVSKQLCIIHRVAWSLHRVRYPAFCFKFFSCLAEGTSSEVY